MRSLNAVVMTVIVGLVCSAGCGKKKPAQAPAPAGEKAEDPGQKPAPAPAEASPTQAQDTPTAAPPAPKQSFAGVPRPAFNRLAAELFLPLFWRADDNGNGALDSGELSVLRGFGAAVHRDPGHWLNDGKLTVPFAKVFEQISGLHAKGNTPVAGPDNARRAAILAELRQGRPTLIRTTFENAPPTDRPLVKLITDAAVLIEEIYGSQRGISGMADSIPASDVASKMVLYRNQGPWCVAPKTERDPKCSALVEKPARISGLYPRDIQEDAEFCTTLAKRPDAKQLMHHFAAVQGSGEQLKPVPYHQAYRAKMARVANLLDQAAKLLEADKKEEAFRAYLVAAAKAFRDGSWPAADEAWSRMNARNSRWYLRIGPDEVYFEPCSRKAGFHVSFARINQDSLRWQDKLDPIKTDMENAIAALAGAPYKARKVAFHLPDFIDIVLNAADSRSAHGATIGQSLPNWGPVANEGRGRTVAMTNLYTDPDSTVAFKEQAKSLICAQSLATITWDQEPAVMSTVLHEAAHNLGPAHEYKVGGKTDDELFGGPLASTMEELKAQTAALWLNGWLAKKGTIDSKLSHSAWGRDVLWAFGHISRGMYNSRGKPKPYSQLASIQLGFLLKNGVLQWEKDTAAPNGKDKGCFTLAYDKFGPASVQLMRTVAQIKAKGDKAGALQLRQDFVDADGQWKTLRDTITERWLRTPKATFVYAIDL